MRCLAFIAALLLAFVASRAEAQTVPGPASPAQARIYFFRPPGNSQYLAWAPVTLNGATVGAVGPGNYFFRDVAPGTYAVAVNGDMPYPDDHTVVTVAPGGTAFGEVYNIQGYGVTYTLGPPPSVKFPNVYGVRPVDPARATREMAGLSLGN